MEICPQCRQPAIDRCRNPHCPLSRPIVLGPAAVFELRKIQHRPLRPYREWRR